ncbi:MAG: type I-MYXAN CRISPR-associated protein Cas5/Cmx5/DevS [Planctomycetota bacterium]|nr:MAG: type I-MYXAN CRISPR-associated protein Cas5/Cmx5/DevS [Planctomycetota bacterium]
MIGLYVTVPIACFRKGLAREYLETEPVPPPSTCYGFLLSLVGETNRWKHLGCRVTPMLLNKPVTSVVLRTIWRIKDKKLPIGSGVNVRPDFQQLLSQVGLIIWLDSSGESNGSLECRVKDALENPETVTRFGGLSLGESSHLVDDVCILDSRRIGLLEKMGIEKGDIFLTSPQGKMTLPIWVDHVGASGTRYANGDLISSTFCTPEAARMPLIHQ